MLTIISAHSPSYSSPDHSTISLMVKFEEFQEEIPFNATPFDPMPHGVELFNRAMAGEFGNIIDHSVAFPDVIQPTSTGTQTL